MTSQNGGIDLVGVGKVAEAIPPEAWKKAVDTASETFSDLIAPITKTTAGLGRLIEAKFNRKTDVEKIFAADAVQRAQEKIRSANLGLNPNPSARVLVEAIEESSVESDSNLREVWANLLANEMTKGGVHPEFPKILSKLSSRDAMVLSALSKSDNAEGIRRLSALLFVKILSTAAAGVSRIVDLSLFDKVDGMEASREYLQNIGLVVYNDDSWQLTHFGREFVIAVTDPAIVPRS